MPFGLTFFIEIKLCSNMYSILAFQNNSGSFSFVDYILQQQLLVEADGIDKADVPVLVESSVLECRMEKGKRKINRKRGKREREHLIGLF